MIMIEGVSSLSIAAELAYASFMQTESLSGKFKNNQARRPLSLTCQVDLLTNISYIFQRRSKSKLLLRSYS